MTWINYEEIEAALKTGLGQGVKVAILDSGIDSQHPDLAQVKWLDHLSIESRGGRVVVEEDQDGDLFGHGTAVAGIIHSIAPQAELGSIRILGAMNQSRAAVVKEGVRQAAKRGYDFVQCSFGAPVNARDAMVYKSWIDALYLKDMHVVAAGANSEFDAPEWPAHFPTVISVGAGAPMGKLYRKSFSLIELAACGEEDKALWPGGGYRSLTGASFAAPRVSGLLACLLSVYPGLSPLLAKAALLKFAEGQLLLASEGGQD